jgi:hypothetical protein
MLLSLLLWWNGSCGVMIKGESWYGELLFVFKYHEML